jgi:hypothetical protein
MFIIVTTMAFKRSYGEPNYQDDYELADTIEEAQAIIERKQKNSYVPGEYSLDNWAIAEVVDASEPHWIEKKEIWGSDK